MSNKYLNTIGRSYNENDPEQPPEKTEPKQKETILYANTEPLPLNTGNDWRPTEEEFEELRRLYPNVDIYQSFRNMKGWISSNPNRRKTKKGIMRFVNNWLSRDQDSGRTKPSADNAKQKGFNFSDYE